MVARHSSSVAIPRMADAGPRLLRLRADERLAEKLEPATAGDAGRIVVKSREALSLGEVVRVEVSFGALTDEVELSGRVESIEDAPNAAPRITIRIVGEHRERADYVRQVLAGARNAQTRSHRRVPTDIAASWRSNEHRFASRIRDLSAGGAFVVSRSVPGVGESVWLDIHDGLKVEGTVSWVRQDTREAGFGVSFKLRDRDVAAELHRVVREQERASELR